jgi:hypothetical protein
MGCIHRWQIDNHNTGTCPLCGEVRHFPWEWEGREVVTLKKGNHSSNDMQKEEHMSIIKKRHKYYEENKEAIIADLLSLGRAATQKKWGIPVGGTLPSLEKRWLTEEQRSATPSNPGRPKEPPRPLTNLTPSNGRLPPFPQFSDTWDPSVQLAWIDTYRELAKKSI